MKREYDDFLAWQHGNYVRMAIVSAMNKNTKYAKKPLLADSAKQLDEEENQKLIKQRIMAHVMMLNKKFRKE